MKVLLVFVFFIFCFGDCKIINKAENDITGATFANSRLALFDNKNLFVKSNSMQDLFSFNNPNQTITSAKFIQNGVIVGFDNASVVLINSAKFSQELISPFKTKILEPILSLDFIKDKAIFLSKNHAIVYDFINRIYKSKMTNLNSKIIDSKIDENSVFIVCFDRNLYELNLGDFSINKIANLPNLITKVEVLNNKPLVSMIDGKIWYENQIYEISKNKISAIKVGQNALYFGDSKSNLIISDLNFNVKKEINLKNDEIKEIFVDSSNLLVVMWNRAIYSCDLNQI